ncbi:MAG: DUF4124 domain-containing protein [Gammaproteobacteria bacterium]|nr:DUF4124 domain-containing protein [Gammaproteobacteria bacterium]
MRHVYSSRAVLLALILILPLTAQATVYKCTDADGGVTYSQTPCANDEDLTKIISLHGGSQAHDVQCGIVKNFAFEVGLASKEGKTINELAAEYGGESSLSPLAVNIMRSVYQYQSQPYKTIEDSVAREAEICKSERYGVPACADFPIEFVTEYGGCGSADDSRQRLRKMADWQARQTAEPDNRQMQERLARASEDAHDRERARRDKEACLTAVENELDRNASLARQPQSPSAQEQLREERRELMLRRKGC